MLVWYTAIHRPFLLEMPTLIMVIAYAPIVVPCPVDTTCGQTRLNIDGVDDCTPTLWHRLIWNSFLFGIPSAQIMVVGDSTT